MPLTADLAATAEIKTGRRRIIEFLFATAAARGGGRERAMKALAIANGTRRTSVALGLSMLVSLSACDSLGGKVIDNANRALERSGQSEAYLPIGPLFGREDGAICIVLGELNELHFSHQVPLSVRDRIAREIEKVSHEHMYVTAHVFDREGRAAGALSMHWRNPRLYVDTPNGQPDMDVCFGPQDRVLVHGSPPEPMTIIYSLEPDAHA